MIYTTIMDIFEICISGAIVINLESTNSAVVGNSKELTYASLKSYSSFLKQAVVVTHPLRCRLSLNQSGSMGRKLEVTVLSKWQMRRGGRMAV
jgi:hypothetical protein